MTRSVKFQLTAFIILFDSFPKVKLNLGSQVPEKNSFASFFYFGGNIIRPYIVAKHMIILQPQVAA